MRLYGFELKKFVKNKKNRVLLIVYIMLVVAYAGNIFAMHKTEIRSKMDHVSADLKATKQVRAYYEDLVSQMPEYESYVADYGKLEYALDQKLMALKKGDRHQELLSNIDILKAEQNVDTNSNSANYKAQQAMLPYQIEFYEKLKEEKMAGMDLYEEKGFNFLYLFAKEILPIVLVIFPLIWGADSMSSEYERGSIKFLLLQPKKRAKIVIAKIVATFTGILLYMMVPIMILFLIIGILNGFGDSAYPVLAEKEMSVQNQYDVKLEPLKLYYSSVMQESSVKKERAYLGISQYSFEDSAENIQTPFETMHLCEMSNFLVALLPNILLYLLFGSCLSMLISTVVSNTKLSLGLCGAVSGLCESFYMYRVSIGGLVGKILPTSYVNACSNFGGTERYGLLSGTWVLSGSIVLIFLLIIFLFRKKDIKC